MRTGTSGGARGAHRRPPGVALALCAALASGGCSSGPAAFWSGYHPSCVVERTSDPGPWGGTRMLRWTACGPVRFSREEARAFAERHGWELLDEVELDAAAREVEGGEGPRFMQLPSTVMRFDSGWLRETPRGGGGPRSAVGYVQVARDGSSLYVFHAWGD